MAGGFATPVIFANAGSLGETEASTTLTSLTSGGSANTMGSWTQIGGTTANDYTHLLVQIDVSPATGDIVAFDIAAATAGNEASGIIIANWLVDKAGSQAVSRVMPVGLLGAGTRIAMRFASPTTSDSAEASIIGFDGGYAAFCTNGKWDTYGWTSGAIAGIQVDPGDTPNTKGAWSEITSSTTNDYAAFMLAFDTMNYAPTGDSDTTFLVDIGVGGSPIVLVLPNIFAGRATWSGGGNLSTTNTAIFWHPIPAGSRIVARAESRDNTAARFLGVSFYGLRL